jgi:hypothetical protein
MKLVSYVGVAVTLATSAKEKKNRLCVTASTFFTRCRSSQCYILVNNSFHILKLFTQRHFRAFVLINFQLFHNYALQTTHLKLVQSIIVFYLSDTRSHFSTSSGTCVPSVDSSKRIVVLFTLWLRRS